MNIPDKTLLQKFAYDMDRKSRAREDIDRMGQMIAENEARLAGRYNAKEVFEYLQERMTEFQKGLNENEELGIRLANFGAAADLHVRSIGYSNPNLIEFSGVDPNSHEVTLVQHISQLSFMLVAMKPIEEKAYRIGFVSPSN